MRGDDSAVSPVIGTVVLVAIVLTIAVSVFVLINRFSDTSTEEPSRLAFTKDETSDSLRVISFEAGDRWADYQVRMTAAGDFERGMAPSSGAHALPADVFVTMGDASGGPSDVPIEAAHEVWFCTAAASTDVSVTIVHTPSNSEMGTFRFSTIAACPP